MFGRSKGLVGLDIGSSAVKAVEFKASGKSYRVVAYASEDMAPDSIVDGAIIDGAGVADTIRRVFERLGTKTKDVAASLSGNAVIVKKISLPADDRGRAGRVDPLGGRAVHPVRRPGRQPRLPGAAGADGGAKNTMDVLLVAAKKDKIADYTGVIAQAGRIPVVVDVDAFAIQNAFEANYDVEPGAVTVLHEHGRERRSTSTSSAARRRSSRETCRSAATPTPRRCSASST